MDFFVVAFASLSVSFLLTRLVRVVALRYGIVDKPGEGRKIHREPMPLLGGVALYGALVVVIGLYFFFRPEGWHVITDSHVQGKHIVGILGGGLFLILGGVLDDIFRLPPRLQILWPIAAALTIIASGIGVEVMSNPFGGVIHLDQWKFLVLWWNDLPRYITVWADVLTFAWLLGTTYTTKILDGLDGLVSGITVIGMLIIAVISLFLFINIPTAMLAVITASVFAGFLFLNFYPAKIFLGESGSTLAGYLLGVFAIISGAKFATLLLILGIPILDILWVICRRVFIEKRSPLSGDRKHLHFRLLDAGFSHRSAVLILYFFTACFGILGLFLQSSQKVFALSVLAAVMLVAGVLLVRRKQRLMAMHS